MTAHDTRIGNLLVKEGLVSDVQLADALRRQRAHSGYIPLGQILVSRKIITQRQLDLVLTTWSKRLKLGDALVRSGIISQEQLEQALTTQKSSKGQINKEGRTTIEELVRVMPYASVYEFRQRRYGLPPRPAMIA